MFQYSDQVHFDQCDPAGVIFYSRAFDLAHRAFEGLVMAAGITREEWFASEEFVVPIVHGEVDFRAPLRLGQTIEVQAVVEKIGGSSVTFSYRIQRDEQLCATLRTVHVFMEKATNHKMPIPDNIRSKLEMSR